MRKTKILAFFLCIVLVVALAAACGQMQQTEDRNNRDNNTTTPQGEQTRVAPRTTRPRTVVPMPGENRNVRDTAPGDNNGTNINANLGNNDRDDDDDDYTERVENIAERAAELKEIESATCVITGNTALVGVQFNDQYKGGVTDRIKEKVERVCKDEDPEIDRVIVTADPDVFARIEDILRDIGEGRPVSGFAEEIEELINRIQPK